MAGTVRGRFAPSPSGRMHLGNLFSALLAWLSARSAGGALVLRMEDLDPDRCRPEYAAQLADDLHWLGLDWDEGYEAGGPAGPYFQSGRTPVTRRPSRPWRRGGWFTPASAPGPSAWRPPPPTAPTGRRSIPADAAP